MARLRSLWLRLHRWLALGAGWLLALVGLAGAVLVVAQPVDRAVHADWFRADADGARPAALEPMRARLAHEFGAAATLTFRPPREPADTLWVLVRGPWAGTVYLDPATGTERGRRGDDEGFVNVLFALHSSLFLHETGKALLAGIALVALALLATGALLWWPRRWPPSLRIELRNGLPRALADLHRSGGAVLGLVIAVSVASGAYMAWRPLGDVVTRVAGGRPLKPPALPTSPRPPAAAAVPLDALVAAARSQLPDGVVGYVQLPARPDRPARVRLRLPDDPHPNGLSSVWIDPRNGAVLRVDRWNELDTGARWVAVIYPLHTGVLGGGWLQPVAFVSGTTLFLLGASGLWLWWRRRWPTRRMPAR